MPFMVYAALAGTGVALAAGVTGYFLVLRAQVFTADALSHVAFTGALGALAFGLDARVGLFVTTAAVAVGMGAAGRSGRPDDVVIGGVFAWVLGLGVLFLSIFATRRSGGNGSATVSVLFGSIFGLSQGSVLVAIAIGLVVSTGILLLARPLVFASVDPAVAAARGVPVRLLGYGFLLLVGLTAAESTQVVGALLVLGLMATPAAAALRVTARPLLGMALAAVFAVAAVWVGLAVTYVLPRVPPSFAILAVATSIYLVTLVRPRRNQPTHGRGRRAKRRQPPLPEACKITWAQRRVAARTTTPDRRRPGSRSPDRRLPRLPARRRRGAERHRW
jgi:zinc/manganese transport system permease protein